jgi:vacuolar protein sorting-associated protein 45
MQKRKGEEYNLLPVAEDYFNTIFGEIAEMKGLILDSETSGIISIIYTQSKLYKNDVYLIQKIEDVREKLMHLKAVYFVRPTRDNIQLLKQEIANPHFKEYHLFFTN